MRTWCRKAIADSAFSNTRQTSSARYEVQSIFEKRRSMGIQRSGLRESRLTSLMRHVPPTLVQTASARSPPEALPPGVEVSVCICHALSALSERTWSFAVPLIFLAVNRDSFLFISLFGLVQALGCMILSPAIGLYIDEVSRLKAPCFLLFIQNYGLVLSAISALVLLSSGDRRWTTAASIGMIVFGVFARVGAVGSTIAIEKDWSKALTGSNSLALARLNSTLRTIDLSCAIVAPILFATLTSFLNTTYAVVQVLIFSLFVWFPQVALLRFSFNKVPQLGVKVSKVRSQDLSRKKKVLEFLQSLFRSFGLYFKQSSVLATMALAVLYSSVLCFGVLMTAYVKWSGLNEAVLSLYIALGSLTGVLGAKSFPYIHRRLGLLKTGLLAISLQLGFLLLGAGPDIVNGSLVFLSAEIRLQLLVWGVALSRFGLWLFDLSVSQIIQENVNEQHLGQVCGTQNLIQSFFELCTFICGILASNPKNFKWLMLLSLLAVSTSFVLFLSFVAGHYKRHINLDEIEMTN